MWSDRPTLTYGHSPHNRRNPPRTEEVWGLQESTTHRSKLVTISSHISHLSTFSIVAIALFAHMKDAYTILSETLALTII